MSNISTEFQWAIPLSESQKAEIWKEAILTVDANVLLDLYRYHKNTSDSILSSLKEFGERLWISHQAMREFFNNREKVIIDSVNNIMDSNAFLDKLNSEIDEISKKNRSISKQFINAIKEEICKSVDSILNKDKHCFINIGFSLDYDPILNEIIELFGNRLGNKPKKDELDKLKKEAEERIINKIPPGYKDSRKDGDRKYGDYLLWKQILEYGKEKNKPIIFITSEQKEDWWDIKSGKTIGLRKELKQEAWEYLQQPIVAYETDRFLEFSQKMNPDNHTLNEAIEEIQQNKLPIVNNVEQKMEIANSYSNIGYISFHINRDSSYFTVSGHFQPILDDIPKITVELLSSPNETTEGINILARTGTNYDFNVHFKSYNTQLKAGLYTFKYSACITENDVSK
ncbi:hypothetical protein O1Q79_00511 [Lonepinella sp. MS14434]|uniref:PIN domain-containing protein n=1 Tax=Lonepinella sp. MS14434 TaxID=3003617 RepID=UPI0036DA87C0